MWRDIKVRYKQTALGAAWAVIQPLLLMVVFTIFIGQLGGVGPKGIPYPIFSLRGARPVDVFLERARGRGEQPRRQLESRLEDLLPATPDPARRALLVPARSASSVSSCCCILMAGYGVRPSAHDLLAARVRAVCGRRSRSAPGCCSSALNVRYRDVRYAVPFLIQFWLFATPVAYQFSVVGSQYRLVFALNPMVTGIEGFRWALLGTGGIPTEVFAISSASALVLFARRATSTSDESSGRSRT